MVSADFQPYPFPRKWRINWDSQQLDGLQYWWPLMTGGPHMPMDSARSARDFISGKGNLTESDAIGWERKAPFDFMPRFIRTSDDYYTDTVVLVTAYPFSVCCWFYTPDTTPGDEQTFFSEADATVAGLQTFFNLRLDDTAGNEVVQFNSRADNQTPTEVCASTLVTSPNTWHHACGVGASATDRRCFTDGANKGTNVNTSDPFNAVTILETTSIGRLPSGGLSLDLMDGWIADLRVYDRTLSDAEVAELYDQSHRWDLFDFRAQAVVAYARLAVSVSELDGTSAGQGAAEATLRLSTTVDVGALLDTGAANVEAKLARSFFFAAVSATGAAATTGALAVIAPDAPGINVISLEAFLVTSESLEAGF